MKKYLTKRDIEYLIGRHERIVELLTSKDWNVKHMVCTKVLADIALLKATIKHK